MSYQNLYLPMKCRIPGNKNPSRESSQHIKSYFLFFYVNTNFLVLQMIIFEDIMVISGLIPMFLRSSIYSKIGPDLFSEQLKPCIVVFKKSKNGTIHGVILKLYVIKTIDHYR